MAAPVGRWSGPWTEWRMTSPARTPSTNGRHGRPASSRWASPCSRWASTVSTSWESASKTARLLLRAVVLDGDVADAEAAQHPGVGLLVGGDGGGGVAFALHADPSLHNLTLGAHPLHEDLAED